MVANVTLLCAEFTGVSGWSRRVISIHCWANRMHSLQWVSKNYCTIAHRWRIGRAGKQEQCCMPRFSLCCWDLKFSVQTPRRRLWKLVLHSARACGGKHRDTCNKHYSCHNILYAHECTDTHTNGLCHSHVAACLYHTARPKTMHKLKVLSQLNWEQDGAS